MYDVLDAAGTKWNFLPFTPGLVGGHCIGVDPYYLTYKAATVGHKPEVILAGRGINDRMHSFIAEQIMGELQKKITESRIGILGVTFKENVPDTRNSKAALLAGALSQAGATLCIYDPHASSEEVMHDYGLSLCTKEELKNLDALVVAVAHD